MPLKIINKQSEPLLKLVGNMDNGEIYINCDELYMCTDDVKDSYRYVVCLNDGTRTLVSATAEREIVTATLEIEHA